MSWARSAHRFAEGRPVDADGVAAVAEAIEQGLDEGLVAEEVGPLGIIEIGCGSFATAWTLVILRC